MTRDVKRFGSRLSQKLVAALRREDGSATVEFVIALPVLMTVFMASFESGFMMTRSVMVERSVDMTMRELRLGHFVNPTFGQLKADICSRTLVIPDCFNVIKINMQPVSTTTWGLPTTPPACVDRSEPIRPDLTPNPGAENELMLVQVCVTADAMFPTTGIGLALPKDPNGGYFITATSAYVNEPSS